MGRRRHLADGGQVGRGQVVVEAHHPAGVDLLEGPRVARHLREVVFREVFVLEKDEGDHLRSGESLSISIEPRLVFWT